MNNESFASLVKLLLPESADLQLETLALNTVQGQLTLTVVSAQSSSDCPLCHQPAIRIHSRYSRSLIDLPWASLAVKLSLRVRRFFCLTPACSRRIFTERLPALVAPWARRTKRLANHHCAIGLALGGAAGSRIATELDQPASRNTLLRAVRSIPDQQPSTPQHLGVDDFAFRKGQTYGTILIDLDRHCPIELLPERTAEALCTWLQQHPGVELISRDRAGAYAEGAKQGAPEAVQVADRWHILKNLGEALIRLFADHPQVLIPPVTTPGTPAQSETCGSTAQDTNLTPICPAPSPSAPPPTRADQLKQQRRDRRHERYDHVQALVAQGVSLHAIARQLHLSRGTVRKYARAATVPLPQPRGSRRSRLDPFKPYLLERWNSGCHVGAELLREIQAQGYGGGRSVVMDFMAALRKQQGVAPMKRKGLRAQVASDPTMRPPTARELAWLVLKRPERCDETEKARLVQVKQREPKVEVAVTLAQEFASMVRERQADLLDGWLERAGRSGLGSLKSFADGIRRDYSAVRAALSMAYSNGVVEGNVNRVKYLKRQMYGRAKFDLLRKRVLNAA